MGYPETIADVGCVGCHASMLCMTGGYTPYIAACASCLKRKVVLIKKGQEAACYTYAKGLRGEVLQGIVALDLDEALCRPKEARHLAIICRNCSSS